MTFLNRSEVRIWLKVSFCMFIPFPRRFVFRSPLFFFLLFRYALIAGMSSPSPHVIPIDSFVYSSVCQKIFEITYRTITIT